MRLTKRTVEAARTPENVIVLWDSELKGFGLKITPKGARIYVVQKRCHGRLRRFTIGRHGSPWTAELARTEALKIVNTIAQGDSPNAQRSGPEREVTVSQLMVIYFELGCRNKKPRTIKNEKSFAERHIKPLLGATFVAALTKFDIEKFMQDVAAGKTRIDIKTGPRARAIVRGGKGVANRTRDLLSSALSFAVTKGYRADNPALGVKNYKLPPRERFLSASEFGRLGQALDEAELMGVNPYAIAILRVLALSGARMGEINNLERVSIDFDASGARLKDSKTGARFLPLGQPALKIIQSTMTHHDSQYVFPDRTRSKPYGGLKKVWQKIRADAGLDDVRLHDLRHSFASTAVARGESLFLIGKVLGHSDPATTKRYTHLNDDPVRLAANETANAIASHLFSGS